MPTQIDFEVQVKNFPDNLAEIAEAILVGDGYLYREDNVWTLEEGGGGASDWEDITNKPETFPPSSHQHVQADSHNTPDTDAGPTSLHHTLGTGANQACAGNDARLSDAREWTAETISIEEAESGEGTTRRAWTANRVRNAIVAWWNLLPGVNWLQLGNIPDQFPPEAHTHPQSDVTDLGTALGSLLPADGWIPSTATWSYSSEDSPVFVISINADVTGILQPGYRIKLTQATTQYFIVHDVGEFSGGVTLVTVYGGTDYTLANAAITTPFYSPVKAPFGFSLDPAKWTVLVTDTSNLIQNTPTASVWYNLLTIVAPIGLWRAKTKGRAHVLISAGTTSLGVRTTLSTANNTESNTASTTNFALGGSGLTFVGNFISHEFVIAIASKTTLYLNLRTGTESCNSLAMRGDLLTTELILECAYL